jgi:hypothetical protein
MIPGPAAQASADPVAESEVSVAEPGFDVAVAHRWFAVETNNAFWDLLERPDRSREEDRRMVDLAHASAYHWSHAGDEVNRQRADVALANAYAATDAGDLAVAYAKRALAGLSALADRLADWDRAVTLDALSRAYAAAGGRELAARYRAEARAAGDALAEDEDRAVFDRLYAPWPFRPVG